jgi:hypothetical protein
LGWGQSPVGTPATNCPIVLFRMMDEYGTFGGMKIGRGNRRARRKPAPVPLRPQQIPHDLIWDRTRTVAVGSRQYFSYLEGLTVNSNRETRGSQVGEH